MTRINSQTVLGTCYFFSDEYLQGGYVIDTYKDLGIFYTMFSRNYQHKWKKITDATSYYEKSNEVRYLFLILSSCLLT